MDKDNTKICTIALTWHPERKRKVDPKTTWRRTTEQERSQRAGAVGSQQGW